MFASRPARITMSSFINGALILNTGPCFSASPANSADMLPVRICGLNNRSRIGTVGSGRVWIVRRSAGPARVWLMASAMARPSTSMPEMATMRSSAASSRVKIKRKTSQVWMRETRKISLGSGISLSKMTLLSRVFTNSVSSPSSAEYDWFCQVVREIVQNPP